MSEEVSRLVVKLDMDSIGFQNGITRLNRQMKVVQSEFKAASAKMGNFGKSTDGLRLKSDSLTKQVAIQQAKVQALTRAYSDSVKNTGENSKQTELLATKLNRAQAELSGMENQLKSVNDQIKLQSSKLHQFGQSMQNIGSKMKDVGQTTANAGKQMSLLVTGPLVAVGAIAGRSAIQFESAFAGVRKTIDATEPEFKQIEASIRQMSKTIPASATEISKVAEAAGQLGIKKENIMGFTRTMVDLGVATNMTSDQAANDLARLANITQMPQTQFDRLGATIVALGNNFATTESEITAMGLRLAGQGKQIGLTEHQILALATAMSSVGIEAEAGGTAMSTIMKKIQSAVGSGGRALEGFAQAAGMSTSQFKEAFEKDATAAILKFIQGLSKSSKEGKNLTDILARLGIKGIRETDTLLRLSGASNVLADSLNVASDGWKENTALTNEAEQRYKTTESQLKILKNKLNDVGITLGQALLPALIDIVGMMEPFIQKLADAAQWFSDLDPRMQKVVLSIVGVVAAIGPLLVIAGSLISALGSIVTAIGTVSGALAVVTTGATAATPAVGALAGAISLLTGPVGIAVAAIAALGVATFALVNHLKKPSLEIEIFGDKVSKGTKKAVSAFLDLNNSATEQLRQLEWSGNVVSKSAANKIVSNFSQMGDQMLAGLKKQHDEQLSTMQEFFANSTILNDQMKQDTINKMNERYTEQSNAVKNGESIIKGILEKASAEKRALTEAEKSQINLIQEGMVNNGIKYLSKNELESKSILERMKAQAGKITAEQAAEVVKNSNKQTTEATKAANDQYNKVVKEIIRQRDEVGSITAEQASIMILDAKTQRDKTVSHAKEMHKNVVSEAKKQAGEHVDQVDWEKGEVLSKWEMMKKETKQKLSDIGSSISKKWNEIRKYTSEKWEEIKAWPGKKLDEMNKTVVKKAKEIAKSVTDGWSKAEKFLSEIDLIQIGKDVVQGFINGINDMGDSVWEAAKNLGKQAVDGLMKFLDMHSPSRVTHKLGEHTGQGFANGIAAKKKAAEKAAKAAAQAATKAYNEAMSKAKYKFEMGKINSSQYISELRKIREEYAKTPAQVRKVNLEIKKIQEKHAKEIKAIEDKKFRDALKTIKDKAAANKISTDQELKQLQTLAKKYKKNSDERLQIDKEIAKVKDKLLKEQAAKLEKQFSKEKDIIHRKKDLNQLSLTQELALYEKNMKAYKKGSEQRKYYEEQIYDVKKRINDRLISINDEYTNKIQEANQKLIDGERQLTEEYQKAVDDRAKSLYSFAGLFDEIKRDTEVSGQQLIDNLKGQVEVFTEWQTNISSLAKRGISEGLLKELQEMGPKSAAEIAALNSLTDEQLAEYVALWQTKNSLAKEQATTELEGMKTETQQKIKELREQTKEQLNQYKTEWIAKIKEIKTGTKNEFNAMTASMKGIGKNTIQGLMDGLSEMTGPLMKQAKSIADSISATIKKALDIHSPSRVMIKLGGFVGEGLSMGMANTIKGISQQALLMAKAAIPNVNPTKISHPSITISEQSNIPVGTSIHQTNNFYSPKALTPSETARQNQKVLQRMGFAI